MPDSGFNPKYYRHCDWLVANTGIADYLVREGVPADRVHHQINFVPDGMDGTICRPKAWTCDRGLGRLHPNKAFDTLIRAFATLEDSTLWLAGDGRTGRRSRRWQPSLVWRNG